MSLINREDLIAEYDRVHVGPPGGARKLMEDAPTVEPERKKGEWKITEAYPHNVYCSECHKRYAQTHWEVWEDGSLPRKYCPNCGAKMEGVRSDGTD